jgi:hypothetical protein
VQVCLDMQGNLDTMNTTQNALERIETVRLQARAAGLAAEQGQIVDAVVILNTLVGTVETALGAAVALMRADGHSWAAVGQVLGVSRQAVQQRFGWTEVKIT